MQLHDFQGEWQIAREIDDRHARQQGVFSGRAVMTRDPGGLQYAEAGVLRFAQGAAFKAERTYLWAFEGDDVVVRFDDGRDFHRFTPAGRSIGTDHPCGADLYRVAYDFTGWPRWEARWTVSGPRKDYTMSSTYTR